MSHLPSAHVRQTARQEPFRDHDGKYNNSGLQWISRLGEHCHPVQNELWGSEIISWESVITLHWCWSSGLVSIQTLTSTLACCVCLTVETCFLHAPALWFFNSLSNSAEGQALLKHLKYAFHHGLTFSIGTSLSTGQPNCVIWASIHHKTYLAGGMHGWPDLNYFINCNQELDSLGVPPATQLWGGTISKTRLLVDHK